MAWPYCLTNSPMKCPGAFRSAARNILQMGLLDHFNYRLLHFSTVYMKKCSLQRSHSVLASYVRKFQLFLI